MWKHRPPVCLALVLLLAGPACGFRGLAFQQDTRLRILEPEDRSTITFPLTLRWTIEDFEIAAPGEPRSSSSGYFAVFFDRAPVPPRKPLAYMARHDVTCRRTPGCPDDAWYARHNIYRTTGTHLTIRGLTDTRPRERPQTLDQHEAFIVFLDAADVRIGESAFHLEFVVDRGYRG